MAKLSKSFTSAIDPDYILTLEEVTLDYVMKKSFSLRKIFTDIITNNRDDSLITKEEKHFRSLSNINLKISRGENVGIIGNNGAGKTTLLKVLAGIVSPSSGQIHYNTKSISLLTLGAGFTNELTGRENIYLNGLLIGLSRKFIDDNIDNIIEFAEIAEFIDNPVRTYSSGMVSRLGFSIAIHRKPELLLIDEVLSVGDIHFKEKSYSEIKKLLSDSSRSVVLVQHDMNSIKEFCNRVIWIEHGSIVEVGDTSEVVNKYLKS